MRLVINYILMLGLGVVIAFGLAKLAGLLWPRAVLPIFLLISVWWLWVGWRHASAMDRARQLRQLNERQE